MLELEAFQKIHAAAEGAAQEAVLFQPANQGLPYARFVIDDCNPEFRLIESGRLRGIRSQ
ncbi:hypothetical protein [Qipengyuania sp.]|uniref:hypothetical protein n=1 Tax=Qipengyuania sp. TaxID=2004515 RepID=UPI0035176461